MRQVTCINNQYYEHIEDLQIDGKYLLDLDTLFIGTSGDTSIIVYTLNHKKLGRLPLKLFTTVYDE